MKAKFISGIAVALLLIPVAASADDVDVEGICYADPLDAACSDVLSEVDEVGTDEDVPVVTPADPAEDEVEPSQVMGVSQSLAETGVDAWVYVMVAMALLAVGGGVVFVGPRRQTNHGSR